MTTVTAIEHAQTLAEFREAAAETLERVNRTGEPEAITVDGEVRAMLVPAAVYEALVREQLLARDVAAIRRSEAQIGRGEYQTVAEVSAEIRATLLAKKAAQQQQVPSASPAGMA